MFTEETVQSINDVHQDSEQTIIKSSCWSHILIPKTITGEIIFFLLFFPSVKKLSCQNIPSYWKIRMSGTSEIYKQQIELFYTEEEFK
jgi:hypothetical protein